MGGKARKPRGVWLSRVRGAHYVMVWRDRPEWSDRWQCWHSTTPSGCIGDLTVGAVVGLQVPAEHPVCVELRARVLPITHEGNNNNA